MSEINKEAIGNYNFIVEYVNSDASKSNKECIGGFSKISGMQTEVEYETYNEGGLNNYAHMLPKNNTSQRIILEKGVALDDNFLKWYYEVSSGILKKRDIYISVKSNSNKIKKIWRFTNSYPVKWSGPELNSLVSEIAVERIELVFEEMKEERV